VLVLSYYSTKDVFEASSQMLLLHQKIFRKLQSFNGQRFFV